MPTRKLIILALLLASCTVVLPTPTQTATLAPVATNTPIPAATITPSPTASATLTATDTDTATVTSSATLSPTMTASHTATLTATPSYTPTSTATRRPTRTPASTLTPDELVFSHPLMTLPTFPANNRVWACLLTYFDVTREPTSDHWIRRDQSGYFECVSPGYTTDAQSSR